MIKDFKPRLYQETILSTSINKNTLVVLPTGMGKTSSAFLLAAHRLKHYPNSKILVLACTRPLVDQHYETFKRHLDIEQEKIVLLTGQIRPEKRVEIWRNAKVIIATPQSIENDILSGNVPVKDISLLVVDEAHRAVGNYSYCYVAKKYLQQASYPRILALTASPGSDVEKINEVCKNLFIEAVEIRTDQDSDVRPYIHEVTMDWVKVELSPPLMEIQKHLNDFLRKRLDKLRKWDILKDTRNVSKKDLLSLQLQLRKAISGGERDFISLSSISVIAELMKIYHALELLETQGIYALNKYFGKLLQESVSSRTKAIKNLVKDDSFKSALALVQNLSDQKVEHPKLIELQRIMQDEIKKDKYLKAIVFNQYRDNATEILEKLSNIPGISAMRFVGQQKKSNTGLSQKEQKKMLDDFRQGFFNVLISTSIGEEGLDVPQVDIVIFYEPIPSAIRYIQRRGRTGRHEKGRVIILYTKNTRDESYKWIAQNREKMMYRNLLRIKKNFSFSHGFSHGSSHAEPKTTLKDFNEQNNEQKLTIYADHREKSSNVLRQLAETNMNINLKSLDFADYILSPRVGVELKSVEDFVQSILDGRLLQQLKELKNNFERPIVVIEGQNDIFTVRNVHPNSIRGMLATIVAGYGIPIVQTKNPRDTASLLEMIAKREQQDTKNSFNMHGDKKPMTLREQQEYITAALPGVGAILSKPLLKHFKTIKNIINASVYELQEVEKIGAQKAKQIKEVLEAEYKDE